MTKGKKDTSQQTRNRRGIPQSLYKYGSSEKQTPRQDQTCKRFIRGNEEAWKRMRDLSDHDMNPSSGKGGRKKADGAEVSETPVQF